MGANQSSNGHDDVPQTEAKPSYYELLGVDRLASDEEIKKAYRRKALELHPDRNYGNVDHTTKQFAEIQSAYEVLSDPQERAWYDSHESSILNGEPADTKQQYAHNIKITTADEIVRMMGQFRGNVEFSDKPSGFYGFLRETFDKLAREEQAVAQWEGLEVVDYPSFGHKEDSYSDVVKLFYSMWNGFATKKSFSWKDKWRYSEAPDRRVRRLMEKENRKIREDAIREFNDAVRALVAFVRKRDPRYTPHTQSEADRQQTLREAAAAQAAKSRAENMAKMNEEVPEWAKAREPNEIEELEDEESEEEHYECMACRKTFKSEKQFAAHEKSKKHIKAVQSLRRQLRKEGHVLELDDDFSDSAGVQTPFSDEPIDQLNPDSGAGDEKNEINEDDELVVNADKLSLNGGAVAADQNNTDTVSVDDHHARVISDESDNAVGNSSSASDVGDTDMAERTELDTVHETETTPEPRLPKMGKAAQKRAKKAAQQQASDTTNQGHICGTCGADFPSRNRLFQHFQDLAHGPNASKANKGAKGKKR